MNWKNKGLIFCSAINELLKKQLLENLQSFCHKIQLQKYFYNNDTNATLNQIKLPNCCVNSNHETFLSLQRNLSIVKREVTKLLKKPSNLLKTGIQLFRATLGKSMNIFTDNQRYTKYFIHFKCYDQWSLASVPAHAICQYMSRSNV